MFLAGKTGEYMFRVASGNGGVVNYENKCTTWYAEEKKRIQVIKRAWLYIDICPCDVRKVVFDKRWRMDAQLFTESNRKQLCYNQRFPRYQSSSVCIHSHVAKVYAYKWVVMYLIRDNLRIKCTVQFCPLDRFF